MDKETLSQYGWVVIIVIVLAIMIALATPFGDYIKEAIEAVVNEFGSDVEGANEGFTMPDFDADAEATTEPAV